MPLKCLSFVDSSHDRVLSASNVDEIIGMVAIGAQHIVYLPKAHSLPPVAGKLFVTWFQLRFEPTTSVLRLLSVPIASWMMLSCAFLASVCPNLAGRNPMDVHMPVELLIMFRDLRVCTFVGEISAHLNTQNATDKRYLYQMVGINRVQSKLRVADCRPEVTSRVNELTGGGTKSSSLQHARVNSMLESRF